MQKSKYIPLLIITILTNMIICTYSLSYKDSTSYIWSSNLGTIETSSPIYSVETNSEIENNNSLNLESGAAILIEQST